jgi:hypothetical protein
MRPAIRVHLRGDDSDGHLALIEYTAAERTGDADALTQLLADDFVLVGPLGFMLDKQQYLGSRRSGDLKHESFDWADVRVRIYGESAVAVGTQTHAVESSGRSTAWEDACWSAARRHRFLSRTFDTQLLDAC